MASAISEQSGLQSLLEMHDDTPESQYVSRAEQVVEMMGHSLHNFVSNGGIRPFKRDTVEKAENIMATLDGNFALLQKVLTQTARRVERLEARYKSTLLATKQAQDEVRTDKTGESSLESLAQDTMVKLKACQRRASDLESNGELLAHTSQQSNELHRLRETMRQLNKTSEEWKSFADEATARATTAEAGLNKTLQAEQALVKTNQTLLAKKQQLQQSVQGLASSEVTIREYQTAIARVKDEETEQIESFQQERKRLAEQLSKDEDDEADAKEVISQLQEENEHLHSEMENMKKALEEAKRNQAAAESEQRSLMTTLGQLVSQNAACSARVHEKEQSRRAEAASWKQAAQQEMKQTHSIAKAVAAQTPVAAVKPVVPVVAKQAPAPDVEGEGTDKAFEMLRGADNELSSLASLIQEE